MKIKRNRLIEIIKEELDLTSDIIDDLVYELEHLLGREPTDEEVERIRSAVLAGNFPPRGTDE